MVVLQSNGAVQSPARAHEGPELQQYSVSNIFRCCFYAHKYFAKDSKSCQQFCISKLLFAENIRFAIIYIYFIEIFSSMYQFYIYIYRLYLHIISFIIRNNQFPSGSFFEKYFNLLPLFKGQPNIFPYSFIYYLLYTYIVSHYSNPIIVSITEY